MHRDGQDNDHDSSQNRGMRILRLIVGLALFATPAAAQLDPPDEEALHKSEAAFELAPGVIVDPLAGVTYLMSPDGGIDKVSISSGERLWSTTAAAKPLAVYGDWVFAQAENAAARLEVVALDAARNGDALLTLPIQLPDGVSAGVDEGLGRSFTARFAVHLGKPLVSWKQTERYVGGIAPPPGVPLETTRSGAFRLDLPTSRAVAVDPATLIPAAPSLPETVERWLDSNAAAVGPISVEGVLAATQVLGHGGQARIVLKRWDVLSGQPLPDVELFSGPHTLQLPSADNRHLLVTERAYPGEFIEYEWSVFSLETGEKMGEVRHHRSHAPFFVSEGTVICLENPYGRRMADGWVEEPRKLRAILFGSGVTAWEAVVRDPAYRGPFPP